VGRSGRFEISEGCGIAIFMFFKLYPNSLNQISKGYAKWLFVIGLLLIGFGTLVWILKEVLAVIAAAIFITVGCICCFHAIRIFITSQSNDGRSGNVKIRIEQTNDI
jgi:hypothetical protein